MLRRIILENFMSHGRTEIDLADGLTVLTGPNNCGKSAVVAALQILATNGRSTHVMRHGAKHCRITVETDDDHIICWERSKKGTVKYTLNGEDVHRLGASKIPESLHELLRLDRVEADTGKTKHEYDIHFGEQKSPIFLLGESGSRAASFFASSSDASRLVEMQHRHRTRLRDQRSEAKRLNAEDKKNTTRLKSFEPIDKISEQIADADLKQQAVDTSEQRVGRLKELISQLDRRTAECKRLQKQNRTLSRLDRSTTTPTILKHADQTQNRLSAAIDEMTAIEQQRELYRSVSGSLSTLSPVPELHEVSRIRPLIGNLVTGMRRKGSANDILACCSTIMTPPVMEPTVACRRVLGNLIAAINKHKQIDRTSHALASLQSAPPLNDTGPLHTLIAKIQKARNTTQTTHSVETAFHSLQKPPEKIETTRLRQLTRELDSRQNAMLQSNATAKSLAQLSAPIAEIDLNSLNTTIEKLAESFKAVMKAQSTADGAEQQLHDCDAEIRQFVDANPKCATCGANLDPETLMSSVPANHDHATGSEQ